MKKVVGLLSFFLFFISSWGNAQCSVDIGPDVIINCGDSVTITAMGSGNVPLLLTDFNNNQAGPGWASTGGAQFSQPCGPGVNNTPYYWASTSAGTPALTTVGFDVSCGATITWDMVYSVQGGASPCEGPDLPDEGVTFEYSLDGGITWIQLGYWDPNGGNDPFLTNWNSYTITIPPGAWGPNTMFQWIQYNSSGTCCDNWGIDNVLIVPGLCGVNWVYDWSMIPGAPDSITQTVAPMTTTQYSVILTDGTDICYDTINVIVNPLLAAATTSATDLTCPNSADLDVQFTNNNAGSIVDDFDPTIDMAMWSDVQNGTPGTGCTSMSGNALHFNGAGTRQVTTVPINTTVCGMVDFCLFMGNTGSGGAPCENADAGEDVVFEYSTNGGATWTIITTYAHTLWDNNNSWQCFTLPIPPPAQTTNTMFQWRQLSNSGNNMDNWALDNVDIACAPPAFDYVWTPATGLSSDTVQAPNACPVDTTTYTATIMDPSSGCSAQASVTINVTCMCMFTQFTANVSNCLNGNEFEITGEFEYVEDPGTGTIVVEATNSSGTVTQVFNPPFITQQLFNYTLTGLIADGSPVTVEVYFSDDLSCTSQIVDVSPVLPTLTAITGGGIYCPNDPITDITVDVTGNGPWTVDYTLDGTPMTATGAGTSISLGSAPGVYQIVTVNDSACTNSAVGLDSIVIHPEPTIIDMFGGDTYCQGDSISNIEIDMTGTGPWTVNYTIDGNATSASGTSPVQLGTQPGVYVVTLISDANCSSNVNDTESIIISPAPPVFAGADFISCDGDPITLTATGAQTYVWNNGVTNGVPFVPSVTTTYTVEGTDANGCIATDAITVTVEALPDPQFFADTLLGCDPLTITFVNTTPGNMANCEWNFGDGGTGNSCDTIQNIYNGSGYFDVTLTTTSVNGCVNSITYSDYIYVEQVPEALFNVSSQIVMSLDPEVVFSNQSTGAVNYLWDFGDGSPTTTDVSPSHAFPGEVDHSYPVWLYAYSPIGCVDSMRLYIKVNEEVIYYIPNTFTPDGDQHNQQFQPIFTAGYDPYDFNLKVFNRWGQIVFETYNDEIGWDGTYNGVLVPDGTYTWKIEFKTSATDERMMISGHVNLIR